MKSNNVLGILVLVVLGVTFEISATTHWLVTENGRIQQQHNSVFDMRRPYDLIEFLEQEKRRETAYTIHTRISKKIAAIDRQWANLNSAGDVEQQVYSNNAYCVSAGKQLSEIDFYASIATDGSLREGVQREDYVLKDVPADGIHKVPDCEKTFPLDFSMHTFEHLSAMQNRKNLTQHQEKELLKLLPPDTDLEKFGHMLANSLAQNKTSWIYLNLASIYWRIKGNAYKALECSRRAIISAPRQYRDIPLLTTGGILHAAKHSGEAAIILHMAIDYNPTQPSHHLALGHVYAVLGDFTRSLACYNNCLKLADIQEAEQAKYAILCHQDIERTLMQLYRQLQDILSDLHAYYNLEEELFKLYERMLREQHIKTHSNKIKINMVPEHNLPLILHDSDQSHHHHSGDSFVLHHNVMMDHNRLVNLQVDIDTSLQVLKNVEHQAMARRKSIQGVGCLNFMEPTRRPKYYNMKLKKGDQEFESDEWPKVSDCNGLLPLLADTAEYVPIYLPPENKGYETHLFVNELINIESGKEHPLPWYPPLCELPKEFNHKYISKTLLQATSNQGPQDTVLKPFLEALVKDADIAEIGQRILTATKLKVAAPWVLSMLASLHWRVVGKPRNALDCLQLALDAVPKRFKDVPLVSIASIYYKFGLIDDAVRLTKEALEINHIEPVTNFLFGALLHLRGNYTGAMHHLKQALRVDAQEGRALTLLRTLACQTKYKSLSCDRSGCDGEGIDLHSLSNSINLPSGLLNKYNLHDGDTILCKSQGKNCKRIECFTAEAEKMTGIESWSIHKITLKKPSKRKKKECLARSAVVSDTTVKLHESLNIARITDNVLDKSEKYCPSREECSALQYEPRITSMFVWLNLAARNIDIRNEIEPLPADVPHKRPICKRDDLEIRYMVELEKLPGMSTRKAEFSIIEWLMMMSGSETDTIPQLGTKIANALRKNSSSWTLSLAAAFYWRIEGDGRKAIHCIWQALKHTPKDMQDVPLINLASLLESRNHYQDALKIAQWALLIGPDFVVNHFVTANLYAALGDFETAASFYKSSLDLDPNFHPAFVKLRGILCLLC